MASPSEILLVVDAMTGQDAVNVAESFNSQLDITGVILSKLDGDARGGAALSVKAITGKPIKFVSVGEKLNELEPFYPDRMASRILGMGDVLTLIDRAEETGLFSVLLRPVPMRTEGDEKIDLILSGHNHGGLWRFPKTNAGIAGGGKTILPEFAHGEYKKGGSTMIVGSGITTHTYLLPRIYNAPEVVKVTLLPEIISKYR